MRQGIRRSSVPYCARSVRSWDIQEKKILNARNIGGIVVLLIVVYLILHFLFHVI